MKTYIVGYVYERDELIGFKDKEAADHIAEDWVEIEAESLEDAKERFEEEFQKWKESQKKTKYICATCGATHGLDTEDDLCPKGHDDWLEEFELDSDDVGHRLHVYRTLENLDLRKSELREMFK